MKTSSSIRSRGMAAALAFALVCLGSGCGHRDDGELQGYVEGEFVHVASPFGGALEKLSVQRGARVEQGADLFTLDSAPERAARDEAERRLRQAQATLEDARKGRRPTEMASLEAMLEQARSSLSLAEKELSRQEMLRRSGAASAEELDRARSAHEQQGQRVAQLAADVKTAQLGQRSDQIAAAAADVSAREAVLARLDWELSQKCQKAPKAGMIFDTLYREGEWVAPGRPVVVLLPPQNIKVRAFVPEPRIGSIHAGDQARVMVDGVAEPFVGKVSFISPQAEFTPPVIYSRESRGKLVFMIELAFDPEVAAKLHPGQPVDVRFPR